MIQVDVNLIHGHKAAIQLKDNFELSKFMMNVTAKNNETHHYLGTDGETYVYFAPASVVAYALLP